MNEPLYLDWDIAYKDWLKRRSTGRVRSEPVMRKVLETFGGVRHVVVFYRRSSSGRVHVALNYCGELPFASSLLLRFLLWDDPARIRHDWFRHLAGESTNRLFDAKWKNGKLGRSGPWVPWFTLRAGARRKGTPGSKDRKAKRREVSPGPPVKFALSKDSTVRIYWGTGPLAFRHVVSPGYPRS